MALLYISQSCPCFPAERGKEGILSFVPNFPLWSGHKSLYTFVVRLSNTFTKLIFKSEAFLKLSAVLPCVRRYVCTKIDHLDMLEFSYQYQTRIDDSCYIQVRCRKQNNFIILTKKAFYIHFPISSRLFITLTFKKKLFSESQQVLS